MIPEEKEQQLREYLRRLTSAVVAYSGGVDSTYLLSVAHEVLGEAVEAITAVSPSLARREQEEAIEQARRIGVRHRLIQSDEVYDPRYRQNEGSRCFVCKQHVYKALVTIAGERPGGVVLDGTNADDAQDFRPGMLAAEALGVCSPLKEVGLSKAEIRTLSRRRGLTTWNKPSAACLSSRVAYGETITIDKLRRVERAEEALWTLGFTQLRVRDYHGVASIEVPPQELDRLWAQRQAVFEGVRQAGFATVTVDLEGYRSGKLNRRIGAGRHLQA